MSKNDRIKEVVKRFKEMEREEEAKGLKRTDLSPDSIMERMLVMLFIDIAESLRAIAQGVTQGNRKINIEQSKEGR